MRFARLALPIVLLLPPASLAACAEDDALEPTSSRTQAFGPRMRPGENCLGCHAEAPVRSDAVGPGGRKAPVFTAAGTVFAGPSSQEGLAGARLVFEGISGNEVVVITNEVGNFFTDLAIKPSGPRIEFEGRSARMNSSLPPLAACNACHDTPPVGGAPGRIFVP